MVSNDAKPKMINMKKLLASLAALSVIVVPSVSAGGLYLGGGGSSFEEETTPPPPSGGGSGSPIDARRDYRGRHGTLYVTGYGSRDMWVLESDRSRIPDFIKIDGPKGEEVLAIVCKNRSYYSYGYNKSKTFNKRVVEAWCRD